MFFSFSGCRFRRPFFAIWLLLASTTGAFAACEEEAAAFTDIRDQINEAWRAMALHCAQPGICAEQRDQLSNRCKRNARREFFSCLKECKASPKAAAAGCFAPCRSGLAETTRSCGEFLEQAVVDCTRDLPLCRGFREQFARALGRKERIDQAFFDCARAAGDPDATH